MRYRCMDDGFTLVEVLVAMAVTTVVVATAFGAVRIMEDAHRRESEIAAVKQNTRHGSRCTSGSEPGGHEPGCATIRVDYSPFQFTEMSLPNGFDHDVLTDCAIVGRYHFVQYRIDSTDFKHPVLERRDLGSGLRWSPVSNNIEDLQLQFTVGSSGTLLDTPQVPMDPDDRETWISSVRTALTGRSDSPRLRGSTSSEPESEPYIRWTVPTTISIRNRLSGGDLRLLF